jgi:hypothetical protein
LIRLSVLKKSIEKKKNYWFSSLKSEPINNIY